MGKAFAAAALVVGLLATAGISDSSCVGPAMPGHTADRIAGGVSIIGTDGHNGIGGGDIYTCHNGSVTVH